MSDGSSMESFSLDAIHQDPLLIGVSPQHRAILELIEHAARSCLPVLVTGDVGFDLGGTARLIHGRSARRDGPFLNTHMALFQSSHAATVELFGSETTTVLGDVAGKPGLFERARGGVLYLDEVESTTPAVQRTLLNFFEQEAVIPEKARREVPVDVHVIAGSRVDLEGEVRNGRFDAGLFGFLSTIRIDIPPLRARRQDVEPLVRHFLARVAPGKTIEPAALRALTDYEWPGDIRQLRGIVERVGLIVEADVIRPAHLPDVIASAIGRPLPGDVERASCT